MRMIRIQPEKRVNMVTTVRQDRINRAKVALKIMVMQKVYINYRGVVHYEFLPPQLSIRISIVRHASFT